MDIYAYQRLVGKIKDDVPLREVFIKVFDSKDKRQVAQFALTYAKHVMVLADFQPAAEIEQGLLAVQEWIEGKCNYHKARNIAFKDLYKEAGEAEDEVLKKYYKTMAQLICVPHVKAHGLWGTDMAITLVNALYPEDMNKVREERQLQIAILEEIA